MKTCFTLCGLMVAIVLGWPGQSSRAESSQLGPVSRDGFRVILTVGAPVANQGAKGYWGVEGEPTLRPIERVLVTHKGEAVTVPLSSYADLANARSVALIGPSPRGETNLLIRGGDAGSAYRCTIRIRGGEVVGRRVEDGEFPKNFFEETSYVNREIEGSVATPPTEGA